MGQKIVLHASVAVEVCPYLERPRLLPGSASERYFAFVSLDPGCVVVATVGLDGIDAPRLEKRLSHRLRPARGRQIQPIIRPCSNLEPCSPWSASALPLLMETGGRQDHDTRTVNDLRQSALWLDELAREFQPLLEQDSRANVKIAVLDSGIDCGNPEIRSVYGYTKQIIELTEWQDGKQCPSGYHSGDTVGHGNHVTALLARVALSSLIYVAKVMDSDGEPDAKSVAEVCACSLIMSSEVLELT
jgi:subtilisin family serine protease